jgi:diacylglycerol kinase family enzyme
LRGGGVKPSDHLDLRTDLTSLTVASDAPFPYQLDGDYLGETRRLDFEHHPDAVNLVYPRAP